MKNADDQVRANEVSRDDTILSREARHNVLRKKAHVSDNIMKLTTEVLKLTSDSRLGVRINIAI